MPLSTPLSPGSGPDTWVHTESPPFQLVSLEVILHPWASLSSSVKWAHSDRTPNALLPERPGYIFMCPPFMSSLDLPALGTKPGETDTAELIRGSRDVMSDCLLCYTRSELSCKSLEGQEGLRQLIFHVTCNMKDVGSTIGCQRLAGRLVGTCRFQRNPEGPLCFHWESELPSLPAVKHRMLGPQVLCESSFPGEGEGLGQ